MPEDRKLMHAVEKALSEDERTSGLRSVHVKAVGAAVFVDGEVESDEQRDAVLEVAKGVKGVGLVRDRLQITPESRAGGWREPHRHED
jgi:osmotically-inducible protein OsmY